VSYLEYDNETSHILYHENKFIKHELSERGLLELLYSSSGLLAWSPPIVRWQATGSQSVNS